MINGEQIVVLMRVDNIVFSLLLRTPISSGPRNGEQPTRAGFAAFPSNDWNDAYPSPFPRQERRVLLFLFLPAVTVFSQKKVF